MKRAGWIAVVLPILALLFPWHVAVFGARVAVFHLVAGVAFSVLALELLFARYRRVPLVSSYVPVADLKSRGVAYVAAAMSVCFLFAAGERMALETAARFVVFVGLLAATTAAAALLDQSSRQSPSAVELDEALPMPTQRLDLAG